MKDSILKIIIMEVAIVTFGIVALSMAKQAHADELNPFSVSIGMIHQQGQSDLINDDDVTSQFIPVTISKQFGKLHFGVTLQQVAIKTDQIEEQGLGDSILSLGYDISDAFRVSLKEKIATGDKKQYLSTGKNDTLVQLDFSTKMLDPKTSLYAQFGHRFTGENNSLNTQDAFYAHLRTGYTYANQTEVGVKLDYQESLFENLDDRLGLSAYINKPLTEKYNLSAFAGYDLTETTTIGVSLTGKF